MLAPAAGAQSVPSADERAQRDRSRDLYEQYQQRAREARPPSSFTEASEAAEGPLAAEDNCLKIERFRLEVPPGASDDARAAGASELPNDPFYFASVYLQRYEGACVGRDGIATILGRLNAEFLKRGFTTTRLGIPDQNASSGTLVIAVLPGRVHEIRFEDEQTWGTFANALSIDSNRLLNLRSLEQGLEQLKRVPSQDISFELVPASEPGESDIVIKVKRDKPWRIGATLDDSGSSGTGRMLAGVNLAFDNPLGLSDMVSIGVVRGARLNDDERGTSSTNASYSFPVRSLMLSVTAFDTSYRQKILGQYQTFVSSGTSRGYEFKANYELLRLQGDKPGVSSKTALSVKYGQRTSRSFIDDAEIGVQFRRSKPLEFGLVHTQYLGATRLDANIATTRNTQAEYPYRINTVDASISQPFELAGLPLRYSGSLHGQQSDSVLKASQWISLGNRYTVRGFSGETTIASEDGAYLRNDLETPVSVGAFSGAVYWGVDYGEVRGPNTLNLLGKTMAGTVCGIRGRFGDAQLEVFAGTSLKRPEGFEKDVIAGFSASYQY